MCFTNPDDSIEAIPGFEPRCCFVIKCQQTCMLSLQIAFRASFQSCDLAFYVGSKVLYRFLQTDIVLKLIIVSLGEYQDSALKT